MEEKAGRRREEKDAGRCTVMCPAVLLADLHLSWRKGKRGGKDRKKRIFGGKTKVSPTGMKRRKRKTKPADIKRRRRQVH